MSRVAPYRRDRRSTLRTLLFPLSFVLAFALTSIPLAATESAMAADSAVSPAATDDRRDDMWQEIVDSDRLVIGVSGDAPPFGTGSDRRRSGFEVDLAKAIHEQLGVGELELKTVTTADRFARVIDGHVHFALASATVTRERERVVDFSVPYFRDVQSLLVKVDSGIDSYEDLDDQSIVGGEQGTTGMANVSEICPSCRRAFFTTDIEGLRALENGLVHAVISDRILLMGLKKKASKPQFLRLAGTVPSSESYGIILPHDESRLRDAVNEALYRIWESGRYQSLFDRWFGPKSKYPIDSDFSIEPPPR